MLTFDLSRLILFGQYFPTASVVHRLDPRTKILGTVFFTLALTFSRSILGSLLLLLSLLLVTRLARLPFEPVLRGLRLALPFLAVFLIIQALVVGARDVTGVVYAEWGVLRITRDGLQQMTLSLARIVSFYFLIGLPTLTTTTTQLTHGLEALLRPFRRLGVPATEIALINLIALRFVPTLVEELERVIKAQASRCGEIGALRLQRPDRIARALLPLIVPLFVRAFRRAEELAIAMEARGYTGSERRTKYIVLKGAWQDVAVALGLLAFCLGAVIAPWPPLHSLLGVR